MSFFGTEHVGGRAVGIDPDTLPPLSTGLPTLDFAMQQAPRIAQNYEQQYRVDLPYSLEFELQKAWQASLDAVKERTGEQITLPGGMRTFKTFAEVTLGKAPSATVTDLTQAVANFRRVNDSIKAMRDPQVKSFEQVLEEVMAMRRETSEETARTNEGGGIAGTIAEFIGAAAGTISQRDPLTVATLGLGGVGKTIAAKVLADAALGGALSAPGAVEGNEVRRLLGEQERDVLSEVLYGALGAGALRGAAEGIGAVVSRSVEDQRPGLIDLGDDQLRQMFERMPDTPTNRAVKDIIEADVEMKAANPFGEGEAATERLVLELDDTLRIVNGEPVKPKEGVAPFEVAMRDEDFAIVREEAPKIWRELESANARIERLSTELERGIKVYHDNPGGEWLQLKQQRAEQGRASASEPIGISANGLAGAYTAETTVSLPSAFFRDLPGVNGENPRPGGVKYDRLKESINRKGWEQKDPISVWVNHLGEAYIAEGNNRVKLANEIGVERINAVIKWKNGAEETEGPFSEASILEAALPATVTRQDRVLNKLDIRNANRRYEAAYRAVDAERLRLVAERPQADDPPLNTDLRYDAVEAAAVRAAAAAEGIDDEAARLVADANPQPRETDEPLELTEVDDGTIDIGLPERLPGDTLVTITGDDGNPRSLTIREAMEELDEDVRLEEAMTTCATGGPDVV